MPLNLTAATLTLSNVTTSQAAHLIATVGIQIKSDKFNSGPIYIGASDVSASRGYRLHPGEVVFLPIEKADAVFLISQFNGDEASLFAV